MSDLSIWQLDILLKIASLRHQGKEIIISDVELQRFVSERAQQSTMYSYSYQLVLDTGNVRDIHVVGGWAKFFELLSGEDIGGDEMDFGVTVLTSLGGRHVDDLARAVLDADESVLSQSRTLHRVGGGCTSIGRIEGVLMLLKRRRKGQPSGFYHLHRR